MADTARSDVFPDPSLSDADRLRHLDEAIERGRADIKAGRFVSADEAFDRLEAKYQKMAEDAAEPPVSAEE